MSQTCSFSLFPSVGVKGISDFGGGSWFLGQLHGTVRPVSFDGGVLSDAVALG